MATRQFSRSRSSRPRPSSPYPPAQPTRQHRPELLRQLTLLVLRLRVIYGTAVSAELALRQQAAEHDPEIADCLRGGVCDLIADQIRDLEDVVHRLRSGTSEAIP